MVVELLQDIVLAFQFAKLEGYVTSKYLAKTYMLTKVVEIYACNE